MWRRRNRRCNVNEEKRENLKEFFLKKKRKKMMIVADYNEKITRSEEGVK